MTDYRRACLGFVLLLFLLAAGGPSRRSLGQMQPSRANGKLDSQRIEQIAGWLPEHPLGVGRPIEDRAWWDAVAGTEGFQKVVPAAEGLLSKLMPELTDALYLDYSKTGNRTRWQDVARDRHRRLPQLVLAECLENQGRFLPAIDKCLHELLDERTWVMPAHDRGQRNFAGKTHEVDLMVASESWIVATATYWLGDRLSEATRRRIAEELELRTFRPFEGMVKAGKPRLWWLAATNNWNAVCLAGVTGAALAMIDSAERRAFFVAAAEKNIEHFLSGFTPDGYCSEGIGYWNYGFGHFVLLAETVRRATAGQIDLLADPRIESIARFGPRMEIVHGIYPAFADCNPASRPDALLLAFLNRCRNLGVAEQDPRGFLEMAGPTTQLYRLATAGGGCPGKPAGASRKPPSSLPLHDWFPDAGVYIGRPVPSQARDGLGIALKAGHNAESHNHNDVGTFVVALAGRTPLVDPGSEIYTRRTFSSRRYESNVLNSFGHPVPRVAGRLQRAGRDAAGVVLESSFSDTRDRIVLDLRPAYKVAGLLKLHRTFEYSREGRGSLTVIDEVTFDRPQSFGTALVTFSGWKQSAPGRLVVGKGAARVQVEISISEGDIDITDELIKEDLPGHRLPTRIGIDVAAPVRTTRIALRIRPAS